MKTDNNKRNIGILLAILLVIIVAILLIGGRAKAKASVLRDLETGSDTSIEGLVVQYENQMNEELSVMEKEIALLKESGDLDETQLTELTESYESFAKEVRLLIKQMRIAVAELENQKLDKADLAAYQEAMAKEIAGMRSNIARVELQESTNGAGNEQVLSALTKMEEELLLFQSNYEMSNAQIEEEMQKIRQEIGDKKETIFKDYEAGIWKAMDEYGKTLEKMKEEDEGMKVALKSNTLTLEEMKTASGDNMNLVQERLDNLDENVAKKLDITAFNTYKEGLNLSISGMLSEIDDLKRELSEEKTNRTQSDQEINARIDELNASWNSFQVNGTMTLAQIESSIAALQQVIGDEDISAYGDGTVSGAIVALWNECGDCRIYYDAEGEHFYAEYLDGDQTVLRRLDYLNPDEEY